MISQDEILRDLETLYAQINTEGKEAILNGREKTDPILNDLERDQRRGLTLMIAVSGAVTANLKMISSEIQKIEPEQYYYPDSDLHITVLDLISATPDFKFDADLIDRAIKLVENAVADMAPFQIDFKGIIASNAAILAPGYYHEGLQMLRERLRINASQYEIDLQERYQSISAHTTIARFKSNLCNPEKLLVALQKYDQFNLGVFKVNEIELVIHDWYNRRKEVVAKFLLEY